MSEQTVGILGHAKGLFKDLLTSKKFVAMATGVVANVLVLASTKVGLGITEEQAAGAATKITGLVGAYILGQSASDFQKEAKKIEAKSKEDEAKRQEAAKTV